MANMYRSVLSGGGGGATGDAVAADVLTGKTFSNASATGISGTMPNNGAVSGQATPSQPYTIPAGYHNGEGTVSASGVDFIAADRYLTIGAAGVTNNAMPASISANAFYGYLLNVTNKNSMTIDTAQAVAFGCIDNADNLTQITVSANTPVDISNYDYIFLYFSATGTISIS